MLSSVRIWPYEGAICPRFGASALVGADDAADHDHRAVVVALTESEGQGIGVGLPLLLLDLDAQLRRLDLGPGHRGLQVGDDLVRLETFGVSCKTIPSGRQERSELGRYGIGDRIGQRGSSASHVGRGGQGAQGTDPHHPTHAAMLPKPSARPRQTRC